MWICRFEEKRVGTGASAKRMSFYFLVYIDQRWVWILSVCFVLLLFLLHLFAKYSCLPCHLLSSLLCPPPPAGMKIVYMHDDTETLKDAVALRLTDGIHTVQGTAQVTVLPVNDEKPRLLRYTQTQTDTCGYENSVFVRV